MDPVDRQTQLSLAGAVNFRDLGGYVTADRRRTRYGRVFRSNSLQEVSQADLEEIRDRLRVATVMDLRSPQEIRHDGVGPLIHDSFRYVNLPMLQEKGDYQPGCIESGLVDRYLSYLELAKGSILAALRTIADGQPVIFHCSAGKDRTGVLAAVLLDCVGVDPEAIVSDYAISHRARDEIVGFLRRRPSYVERLGRLSSDALKSDPNTMREFLRSLNERYGGARSWALMAGLPEKTIRVLESTLLEPAAR
jgi:protein-tyrosine phosphatase